MGFPSWVPVLDVGLPPGVDLPAFAKKFNDTSLAQQVLGETFAPVESYTVVALLYWLLTSIIAAGMGRLERRFLIPGTRGT